MGAHDFIVGIASHGSIMLFRGPAIILFRGWLVTMEAPGYQGVGGTAIHGLYRYVPL